MAQQELDLFHLESLIKQNDVRGVEQYLSADDHANVPVTQLLIVLRNTISHDRPEIMENLFNRLGRNNAWNYQDYIMEYALCANSVTALKRLLAITRQPDILLGNKRVCALSFAVRYCHHLGLVKMLIEHGTNLNRCDTNEDNISQFTPLMHAAYSGKLNAMQVLVEAGCDLHCLNSQKENALDVAIRRNMRECAVYLWSAGCNPTSITMNNHSQAYEWIRPRILGSCPSIIRTACVADKHLVYFAGGVITQRYYTNEMSPDVKPEYWTELPSHNVYQLDLHQAESKSVASDDMIQNVLNHKLPFKMDRRHIGPNWHMDESGLLLTGTCQDPDRFEPTSVRAEYPFYYQDGLSYFEATIENAGVGDTVAIGLVDGDYSMEKLPGWDADATSIGYHGDDACAFYNTNNGIPWGRPLGTGDTVGCGVIWSTGEVFFTQNGQWLGVAYRLNTQRAKRTSYEEFVDYRFKPVEPHPQISGEFITTTVMSKSRVRYNTISCLFACVGVQGNTHAKLKLNFGDQPMQFGFYAPTLSLTPLPSPQVSLNFMTVMNHHLVGFTTPTPDHCVYTYSLQDPTAVWQDQGFLFGGDTWSRSNRILFMATIDKTIYLWTSDHSLTTVTFDESMAFKVHIQDIRSENAALFDAVTNVTNGSPTNMFALDQRLVFLKDRSSIIVNPQTMTFEIQPNVNSPCLKANTMMLLDDHTAITVDGNNDLVMCDGTHVLTQTESMLQWSQPRLTGITPRARNHASNAIGYISSSSAQKCLLGNVPTEADVARTESTSMPALIHAFGWNGRNSVNDIDVLIPSPQPSEFLTLIKWNPPIDSTPPSQYVRLCIMDAFDNHQTVDAPMIILLARSSTMRAQLTSGHQLDISARPDLFVLFLRFLHDDKLHFELTDNDKREFVALVQLWAPEHVDRITEALVMTRPQLASCLSQDMVWAYDHPLASDLTFYSSDRTQSINAHRAVLTARSSYFANWLSDRWDNATQTDYVMYDVSFDAFKIVLYYLYTHTIDFDAMGDHLMDVFELACRYALPSLVHRLEPTIVFNLAPDNVEAVVQMAKTHHVDSLLAHCEHYVQQYNLKI